jgi:hypothetical protein
MRGRRIAKTIELRDCKDAITRILYIDYKSRIAQVVDVKLALLFEFVVEEAF